ncbi:MAG: hypothetical protein HYZ38_25740 [Mycobacterium sp.]|nr:hypothetical protein [Mycobacterium sp.]
MPFIAETGTRLPLTGCDARRIAGDMAGDVTLPAGFTRSDTYVAEVDDFITGVEPIGYEDLGSVDRFDGRRHIETEVTTAGGALPVNPSGGLEVTGPAALAEVANPEGPNRRGAPGYVD